MEPIIKIGNREYKLSEIESDITINYNNNSEGKAYFSSITVKALCEKIRELSPIENPIEIDIEQKTELILQDGLTYKSREGKNVTVSLIKPGTAYPFEGDNLMRFAENGKYIEDSTPEEPIYMWDLIGLVNLP